MFSQGQFTGSSCSIGDKNPDFFQILSKEELELLDQHTVIANYQKGEMVCKQRTFASHIMILQQGLVKSFIEADCGNLILQIFAPGATIGLASLIEGNTYFQYSVQTYVESELKLIEIMAFKKVLKNNPLFARKIISLLAEQHVITSGRFFCFSKKQTFGRLADLLLCLSERIYKSSSFPLHLNRKDIAELSCMSVESIARIITRFKEEGLIEEKDDHLFVLDAEKLRLISERG